MRLLPALLLALAGCDRTVCVDDDGDGYCEDGDAASRDCDDSLAGVHPGAQEIWYDGLDQDCDGRDDDLDGDGFPIAGDCDDADATVYPGATDDWYDGVDADCDGADDYDADGDGHQAEDWGDDCADANPNIHPDAAEIWYDGADGDCAGDGDYDADGDGYASAEHASADGYGTDCDDTEPAVNPGAQEIWYDGVDQDCDGVDGDLDGDGWDAAAGDCDDTDPSVNPGVAEVWYDDLDSDCAEDDDWDADGDGHRSAAHDSGAGYGDDCDDADPTVNPSAAEIWYDGIDSDCSSAGAPADDDYDADADGHVSADWLGDDCDDADPSAHAGAAEIWYDGVDQDCLGDDDYDADADGYRAADHGGTDCDDSEASAYPGGTEIWYDGIDGDCLGDNDYDADADGFDSDAYGGDDCDDTDAYVNTGAFETLGDGADSDCDGSEDAAPFVTLDLSSSSVLKGPALGESNDGVVVGVLAGLAFGGTRPGAVWNFLDPAAPWDGETAVSGWTYAGSGSLGGGYDLIADSDDVLEAFTWLSGNFVSLYYAHTDLTSGAGTTSGLTLTTSELSDYQDIDLSWDGSSAGVAACERGFYDWVVGMSGTMSDYAAGSWDYAYTYGETGGSACASQIASDRVQTSDVVDNAGALYADDGAGALEYLSSATAYTDLDVAHDGSSTVLVGATSSGLTIDDGSSSTSFSTSGTPEQVAADLDGVTIYAVYLDSAGDVWLVYGTIGGGFVEVDLGVSGSVQGVDVLVTSEGTLVIAVLDAYLSAMGLAL